MYTALSGQLGAFKHLEVIANNLANMNTTGFKAERLAFENVLNNEALMSDRSIKKDVESPSQHKTDQFLKVRGSYTDLSEGPVESTGNPLDMAIQGQGFFVVQTPQGERYTRAGNFQLDAAGRLVTTSGHPVMGQGGEIIVRGANLQVNDKGETSTDGQLVGKVRIVQSEGGQFSREPGQLFKSEGGTPTDIIDANVKSGAIEGSNVNAVRELTDMILTSRLYEGFQKATEAGGRMSGLRNTRVGSTQG